MNKFTRIAAVVLGIMVITAPIFAQDKQEEKTGQKKMMGMSGSMMCPMMRNMGSGMMGMIQGGMMDDPVCQVLHKFGGPGFFTKYTEELGLSDEQVKKFDEIWFDHKKNVIQKKADLEIAQLELKNILSQDPTDFKKANVKISRIGTLQESMRLNHLLSIEKARNILTADQLKKFSELKKDSMMMKGMMGGQMMQGKMKEMMEGMGKGKKAEPEK